MLTRTAMHDDWNGYKNVRNFNACLDERDCMSFGTFTKLFRYVSKGMHKKNLLQTFRKEWYFTMSQKIMKLAH